MNKNLIQVGNAVKSGVVAVGEDIGVGVNKLASEATEVASEVVSVATSEDAFDLFEILVLGTGGFFIAITVGALIHAYIHMLTF